MKWGTDFVVLFGNSLYQNVQFIPEFRQCIATRLKDLDTKSISDNIRTKRSALEIRNALVFLQQHHLPVNYELQ